MFVCLLFFAVNVKCKLKVGKTLHFKSQLLSALVEIPPHDNRTTVGKTQTQDSKALG